MTAVLDVDGPAAPPRRNGELVFAAPWESRAFGLAVALAEAGRFAWDTFRDRLIARIAADPAGPYWAAWLTALEDVLATTGAVAPDDVTDRAGALRAREH